MIRNVEFKCECGSKEVYVVKLYSENAENVEISFKGCIDCLTDFAKMYGKGLNFAPTTKEVKEVKEDMKFEIIKVDKIQRDAESSDWKRGAFKYFYSIKPTNIEDDSFNFTITIKDEKNNNKEYLRFKCIEMYERLKSNHVLAKVGDLI